MRKDPPQKPRPWGDRKKSRSTSLQRLGWLPLFFSLKTLFFRAVLGLQQNWEICRLLMSSLPNTYIPHYQHHPPEWYTFNKDKPTLTHHTSPEVKVHLRAWPFKCPFKLEAASLWWDLEIHALFDSVVTMESNCGPMRAFRSFWPSPLWGSVWIPVWWWGASSQAGMEGLIVGHRPSAFSARSPCMHTFNTGTLLAWFPLPVLGAGVRPCQKHLLSGSSSAPSLASYFIDPCGKFEEFWADQGQRGPRDDSIAQALLRDPWTGLQGRRSPSQQENGQGQLPVATGQKRRRARELPGKERKGSMSRCCFSV